MASEPGGRANKLGNEFETLWTVRQLIELATGKAVAVRIEPLGDDEKGTEFWVARPDGTREAHQCKRENGSVGHWSVVALEARGVISNAKFQLDRDPAHRFVFISGDRAPHLSDLCERAAERCESPSEFRQYLAVTSRQLFQEFQALCSCLGVDPNTANGVEQALDFLRRFLPLSEDKRQLRWEVAEARDHRTRRPFDADMLAKVLLRLYEQAETERDLRRRCLDAWDRLIARGIGRDVLGRIDA